MIIYKVSLCLGNLGKPQVTCCTKCIDPLIAISTCVLPSTCYLDPHRWWGRGDRTHKLLAHWPRHTLHPPKKWNSTSDWLKMWSKRRFLQTSSLGVFLIIVKFKCFIFLKLHRSHIIKNLLRNTKKQKYEANNVQLLIDNIDETTSLENCWRRSEDGYCVGKAKGEVLITWLFGKEDEMRSKCISGKVISFEKLVMYFRICVWVLCECTYMQL